MRKFLVNQLLRRLVKPIWRRARAETLSQATGALWLGPHERASRGAVLYLHGGGFCLHLPAIYREFCGDLSRRAGVPVLLPEYRLAPEQPAPAALDDCELAYRHLLRSVPAERIVFAGDSAGSNLALSLLQRCKRVGLP